MTLFYWWMHWFWITIIRCNNCYFVFASGDIFNNNHSTPVANLNATPLNTTTNLKFMPSLNQFNNNNNNNSRIRKTHFSTNMETTVIQHNNNVTETSLINNNDNQTFLNHADNFTAAFIGDEHLNNSRLLNLEKIANREVDEQLELEGSGNELIVNDCVENLTAASITGITLGCIVIVGVVCGVSYILYRNRGFNRPQVLNDRCSNPDSSVYIDDDASIRDNSEEMYSLDNDSFLNSLEAMTIQNYWTDTVKHTKL